MSQNLEFDVSQIRQDFPALQSLRNGLPPIYFDNACGTIPCRAALDAILEYGLKYPACGDRSPHYWGRKVDQEIARARQEIAHFIHARDPSQIVFVKNTTEAINLVARGMHWERGDTVLTGDREHNSNRTCWDDLSKDLGIRRVVVARDGTLSPCAEFNVDAFLSQARATPNVKMVSLTMTSNLDGVTIPPAAFRQIAAYAHSEGLRDELRDFYVLVDGAQTVPHMPVDVQDLDVDFLTFSLHKMAGPTGLGVCYMKDPDLLERALITGGGTVAETFDTGKPPVYLRSPYRYEAGLQHSAGILGAGAAVRYLRDKLGAVPETVRRLNEILTEGLIRYHEQGTITILGPLDPAKRGSICTFEVPPRDGQEDMGRWVRDEVLARADHANLMFRIGDFCVSPYCRAVRGERVARIRLSLYLYNTPEECRTALDVLRPILDARSAVH